MTSRLIATSIAACLCLGLSACGSSGKSTAAPAPSVTAQPSTESPSPSSSASPGGTASGSPSGSSDRAKKLSAAGVLTAADVPGYNADAQQPQSPDEKGPEDALYKCLGLTTPTFLDRNPGTEFSKDTPNIDIDTSADVVESAAIAGDLARAASGQAGVGCYTTYFQSLFAAEGDKLGNLTVSPVSLSVPGSTTVFAFHVVGATTGNDGGPFDTYFVTASYEQTEVTINYTAGGTDKASTDDVTRLAGILINRVKGVPA